MLQCLIDRLVLFFREGAVVGVHDNNYDNNDAGLTRISCFTRKNSGLKPTKQGCSACFPPRKRHDNSVKVKHHISVVDICRKLSNASCCLEMSKRPAYQGVLKPQ